MKNFTVRNNFLIGTAIFYSKYETDAAMYDMIDPIEPNTRELLNDSFTELEGKPMFAYHRQGALRIDNIDQMHEQPGEYTRVCSGNESFSFRGTMEEVLSAIEAGELKDVSEKSPGSVDIKWWLSLSEDEKDLLTDYPIPSPMTKDDRERVAKYLSEKSKKK